VFYACIKIDVMKKVYKNLEFRREVNEAQLLVGGQSDQEQSEPK
jgi:hypothetical protein